MQGLFKRILKGNVPKIPDHFSNDLWTMLKLMIQVQPKRRPNTDEVLEHPIFRKRSQKYYPEFDDEDYSEAYQGHSNLLKTIRLPKNIMHLSSRLPKKNYEGWNTNFLAADQQNLREARLKQGLANTLGQKKSSTQVNEQSHQDSTQNSLAL